MRRLALHVAEHVSHHFQGGLGRIGVLSPLVDPLQDIARHVMTLVPHPVQGGLDVGSGHVCRVGRHEHRYYTVLVIRPTLPIRPGGFSNVARQQGRLGRDSGFG